MLRSACLCLVLLTAGLPAAALDLTVVVEGVDPAKGPLMLALFDRADLFDRAPATQDQAAAGLRLEAGAPRMVVTLSGLRPGRYAATAFQDSDRNGLLGTNFFGIPVEPYGFSAAGGYSRPTFEAASADSASGTLRVRIGE